MEIDPSEVETRVVPKIHYFDFTERY